MCKCDRIINVYMKHNDIAVTNFKHLGFEMEGYLPYVGGVFGGDDTNIDICMDCGKIQNWKPITDEEVFDLDEYKAEQKEEQQLVSQYEESNASIAVTLERNLIVAVLGDNFGWNWRENSDAKEMLTAELSTSTGKTLEAIKLILKELK